MRTFLQAPSNAYQNLMEFPRAGFISKTTGQNVSNQSAVEQENVAMYLTHLGNLTYPTKSSAAPQTSSHSFGVGPTAPTNPILSMFHLEINQHI